MKCSSVKPLIDGYIDGTCEAKKSRSVESHIATCEDCAKELELARRVREMMKALPAMKARDDFEERLFKKTGTLLPSAGLSVLRILKRRTVFIPLGAAAVIVAGLGVFLVTDFRTGTMKPAQVSVTKTESAEPESFMKNSIGGADKKMSSSAEAPVRTAAAPRTKRASERTPVKGYVETEIRLAYNDTAGGITQDLPAPAAEESVLGESARDSDSLKMKKESSSPAKSGAYRSETTRGAAPAESRDDFAGKIDRVILSSGATRVRLATKTIGGANDGGNKASSTDTYTVKVIVPEGEYEGLILRLSQLGTLSAPTTRPVAEKGFVEFTLTVRRGN